MQLMGACKSRYTLTPGKHIELEALEPPMSCCKNNINVYHIRPCRNNPKTLFPSRVDVINGEEEEADVYGQQCNEVCVRAICGPIPIVGESFRPIVAEQRVRCWHMVKS